MKDYQLWTFQFSNQSRVINRRKNNKIPTAKKYSKENVRLVEEKEYVNKENVRLVEEKEYVNKENVRLVEEKAYVNKENARLAEEKVCVSKENARLAEEKECVSKENARLAEEKECVSKENARLAEEKECVSKENARLAEENKSLHEKIKYLEQWIENKNKVELKEIQKEISDADNEICNEIEKSNKLEKDFLRIKEETLQQEDIVKRKKEEYYKISKELDKENGIIETLKQKINNAKEKEKKIKAINNILDN